MEITNSHFKYIPNIKYNGIDTKNIILRTKIFDSVLSRTEIFYDYYIKNSDRADIIAENYYGDSTLDWLIYFANKITDPYYQWPLDTYDFEQFIKKKYGSLEYALQNVKQYEKIIQHKQVLENDIIDEVFFIVDYDTYVQTPINDRRIMTYYDFEVRENDSKRKIKLIQKKYLNKILNEIKDIYSG